MAERASFEALLQALRTAWMRACVAAALQYRANQAGWMIRMSEGTELPRRAVFRPPHNARSGSPAILELDWADLCSRRWMRPASLSISFDCELRQRRDRSWELFIVDGGRRSWWGARPRHRVDIEINGQRDGGGVIRFDGQVWRSFGREGNKRQP